MSVYNVGSSPIQLVAAGDPPTLIVNHSAKNTAIIGNTSGVSIGTQLSDTPLGPYESIVVNGNEDVWVIEASMNAPVTMYTKTNATLWTPRQLQSNVIDSHSPWIPGVGTHALSLTVPLGAQGLVIGVPTGGNILTQLIVTGQQSGYVYLNPQSLAQLNNEPLWISPIFADVDTSVQIQVTTVSGAGFTVVLSWTTTPFLAGPVASGNIGDVNIAEVTVNSGSVPTSNTPSNLKQISPNNNVPFATTVAAGGTTTIVPAGVGVTYLHTLKYDIDPGTNTTANWIVQDTSGTVITNLHFEGVSTTNVPAQAPIDFKGYALPATRGVVLKNNSGASSAIFGNLTYSQ